MVHASYTWGQEQIPRPSNSYIQQFGRDFTDAAKLISGRETPEQIPLRHSIRAFLRGYQTSNSKPKFTDADRLVVERSASSLKEVVENYNLAAGDRRNAFCASLVAENDMDAASFITADYLRIEEAESVLVWESLYFELVRKLSVEGRQLLDQFLEVEVAPSMVVVSTDYSALTTKYPREIAFALQSNCKQPTTPGQETQSAHSSSVLAPSAGGVEQ